MTIARLTAAPAPAGVDGEASFAIPFRMGTLPNGLTVIVHEDHRSPLISTQMRFNVGSKDEPPGRTGFAHLFEHLMFKSRPHLGGNWHQLLQDLGGHDVNGTTNNDRTNYFQTVPKGAFDRLLWMEADRVIELLKSIDARSLADEIAVVKNEKRQTEGAPYGRVYETIITTLYPPHHPYGHSVLGSFEDLDSVDMAAVQDWHSTWYGASNAVLVIAGDITFDEAMAKVERWFSGMPSGRPTRHTSQWIPEVAQSRRIALYDRVPQRRLYCVWPTPTARHPDAPLLSILGSILGDGSHSRLARRLVEKEQLCLNVGAGEHEALICGEFNVVATLSEGADAAAVEAIIMDELARFAAEGPDQTELDRARAMRNRALLRAMDGTAGIAEMLAANFFTFGEPGGHVDYLNTIEQATPTDLQAAAARWLKVPAVVLDVRPFTAHGQASAATLPVEAPAVIATPAPRFPTMETATLSNGLPLKLVRRGQSQNLEVGLFLNNGARLDPRGREGLSRVTLSALLNGTQRYSKVALAERLAEQGMRVSPTVAKEYAALSLGGLNDQLGEAMSLLSEMLLRPTFLEGELRQTLDMLSANAAALQTNPMRAAAAAIAQLIYGKDHAYSLLTEGTVDALRLIDTELVRSRHQAWLDPHAATLLVVGDVSLADAITQAEQAFAEWSAASPAIVPGHGDWNPEPGRYLVETGAHAQTTLHIALASPEIVQGKADQMLFNDLFGGAFGSRLNANLRERRGWTYGASSQVQVGRSLGAFHIRTSVQADRTQDALAEIALELESLTATRPVTAAELEDARNGQLLRLPGRWAQNRDIMTALVEGLIFDLPPGHEDGLEDRLRAVSLDDVQAVAARLSDPQSYSWVVAGGAEQVAGGGFEPIQVG